MPYCQDHDEWVLLLKGAAGLWLEGEVVHDLNPGDWLLIPPGCCHRVTWTAPDEPTIWYGSRFISPDLESLKVIRCGAPRVGLCCRAG
jgi:cupin 2 domain-containing protein